MTLKVVVRVAMASAVIGLSGPSLAQDQSKGSAVYDAGGSKHCDTMTGAERDRCLNDEGAKTEKGIGTPPSSNAADSATPGASRSPGPDAVLAPRPSDAPGSIES